MATWHEAMYRQEWVPLGVFWSLDWDSPDDSLEATVTARDRMELLQGHIPDQHTHHIKRMQMPCLQQKAMRM